MRNWKIDISSLRPIVPALLYGLTAFIIFSPFFLKGQLPLWSTDNLYGSYPPIVYSRENFWHGFCNWMPYYFCGTNFLSSINNMTYSPLLMAVYLLPLKYFGTGLAILQFCCLWSIGYLAFLFIRRVLLHDGWAVFAALTYQLSHQVLFSFQTFPTPILHVFFLLGCYSLWTLGEKSFKKAASFVMIMLSFSGLLLSGHLVFASHFILVLVVLFFYRHGFRPRDVFSFSRPTNVFALALLTAVLICGIRWLPFFMSLGDSSRIATTLLQDHHEYLFRTVRLFIPEVFGVTNQASDMLLLYSGKAGYGGNQHEFFQYFGVLPMFFIILSFVKYGVKDNKFWKLLALFYVILTLRVMPFYYLTNLFFYPVLHGSIILGSTMAFSVLAGFCGKSLTDHLGFAGERRCSNSAECSEALSVSSIMVWSLAILVVVISYASIIWLPEWAYNKGALATAKIALYSILIFMILSFTHQRQPKAIRTLRVGGLVIVGVMFAVIIVFSVVASCFGNGNLYATVLVNEWASIAALFLVMVSLIVPGHNKYRLLAAVFFVFVLVMAIPWNSKSASLMLDTIAWRDNFFILLLGISRLLIIFSLLMLAFFLYSRKKMTEGWFCILCCLISFIDLSSAFKNSSFLVCRPFLSQENKAFYQAGLRLPDLDLHNYRVNFPHHLINPSPLYSARQGFEELSNIPLAYQIPYYGGVNGQATKREVNFLRNMLGYDPTMYGLAADSKNDRLLDLVGARYDLRSDNVLTRPSALSRFMLFTDHEALANDEGVLKRLKDRSFDPGTTLIVSADVRILESDAKPAVKVDYTKRNEDMLYLDLVVLKDGFLLFNDTFDSGWKAFIDGVRVPVYRANYKFMAIEVPAGRHSIRFVFDPEVLRVIKALVWIGVSLFIFMVFFLARTSLPGHKHIPIFLIIAMTGPIFFMRQAYLEEKTFISFKRMANPPGGEVEVKVHAPSKVFVAHEDVKSSTVKSEKPERVDVGSEMPEVIVPPVFVTTHRSYNIAYYKNKFYAVPHSLGPLDLASDEDRSRPGILIGEDLGNTKELINSTGEDNIPASFEGSRRSKVAAKTSRYGTPPTLVASHRNFNIVLYDNIFYAVPHSLGPLDLAKEQDRMRPGILVGNSREDAQRLVDKAFFAKVRSRILNGAEEMRRAFERKLEKVKQLFSSAGREKLPRS